MNWLQKIAQADVYLESIGASPEIISWIMSQGDQKQWYINQFRKNPGLSLSQLSSIQPKQRSSSNTDLELTMSRGFDEPFRTWVLVQYRKLRIHPDTLQLDRWVYSASIRDIPLIYDWWRFSNPRPDIASYTFDAAMKAQEAWHETVAGRGGGLIYEPTDPELVVFQPSHWKGWSVQRVESENDLLVEGRLMNHCCGSYYDEVAASKTNIFSLRDAKNVPHVTIEITPKNEIVQIKGNSNKEPDGAYKAMIKEWFAELQKYDPGLHSYGRDNADFDLRPHYLWRDGSQIDDKINEFIGEDEYGLKYPLETLDISNIYNEVMNVLTRRRGGGDDVSYVYDIGKAIANAAWQADEVRAENWPQQFSHDSANLGVDWLYKNMLRNDEDFDGRFDVYGLDINVDRADYDTEEQYEIAEKERERIVSEMIEKARGNNLPWALDDEIAKHLAWLRKNEPFLPEHHLQNQGVLV